MGRIYTVQFNGTAITAQQDLFEIVPAATDIVKIHEIGISQTSDVGDAEEELLSILLKSGQTTSGTPSTAVNIEKRLIGDATAGLTAEKNNTTKATAGTIVTHYAWSWNVRVPFQVIFTPETQPILAPSRRCTLELATTPADELTCSAYMVIEEIG